MSDSTTLTLRKSLIERAGALTSHLEKTVVGPSSWSASAVARHALDRGLKDLEMEAHNDGQAAKYHGATALHLEELKRGQELRDDG